jgi:hypothetical protein
MVHTCFMLHTCFLPNGRHGRYFSITCNSTGWIYGAWDINKASHTQTEARPMCSLYLPLTKNTQCSSERVFVDLEAFFLNSLPADVFGSCAIFQFFAGNLSPPLPEKNDCVYMFDLNMFIITVHHTPPDLICVAL